MRRRVVKALRSLHAVSIENRVGAGTPDVNCTAGWIELKAVERWPANHETILRVRHFTREQQLWLVHRCHTEGGHAFLLLKVGRDWLLFKGCVASCWLGSSDRATLEEVAAKVWRGKLDEDDLIDALHLRWPCRCVDVY